ncbi:hypothetical protein OSH10_20010 [Kaistia defluvii]|uniref:hypothetical protein n=1 Tax=Kaistia defluvii TaxID=410841 RepID=UPI002255D210|nr:hypothetical protein [Kaistia defluvii]MCX5520731.1 hypothetical protein [Kaistia defluvii]
MIRRLFVASALSLLAFNLAGAAPSCPKLDLRKETNALSSWLGNTGLNKDQRAASMAYLKKRTAAWSRVPLNAAGAACGAEPIAARVVSCTRGMARDLYAQSTKPLNASEPANGELRRELGKKSASIGELLFVGAASACQGAAIEAFGR